MKKIVVLLLILGLSSSAFSAIVQNLVKTTAQRAAIVPPDTQNWFYAANWNGAVGVPQNDTATQNNGVTLYGSAATSYNSSGAVDAIVIANGNAVTGALRVGSNTPNTTAATGVPAALMMNSGTLTVGSIYSSTFAGGSGFMSVGSDSAAGGSAGRNGLFYMNGGDLQALFSQGSIVIGNGNAGNPANGCFGKMWMTGGTIECLNFQIGKNAGVTGEVYLSGGTITTAALTMGAGTKLLDITGSGKLIINGDQTTNAATWSTSGWLTSGGDPFSDVGTATFDGTKTTLMVPEPATLCLLGIGALSLLRRKK